MLKVTFRSCARAPVRPSSRAAAPSHPGDPSPRCGWVQRVRHAPLRPRRGVGAECRVGTGTRARPHRQAGRHHQEVTEGELRSSPSSWRFRFRVLGRAEGRLRSKIRRSEATGKVTFGWVPGAGSHRHSRDSYRSLGSSRIGSTPGASSCSASRRRRWTRSARS